MKNEIICSVCEAILTAETAREFNGDIICTSCFDHDTTICDCCGRRIWRNDDQGSDGITLCYNCYDYNYTSCERCGRLIHNDDAHYEEDSYCPYCFECYNGLQDSPIKSYSFKPEPIFYGSGNLFMGVELEIDKGGEDEDNAEILLDIANRSSQHLYCKHDGSIHEGFEMVTHPMSLDYHINEMNWPELLSEAISLGYRSHQTHTCGLHIHVNRSALGNDTDAQEEAIARIVYFFESHWNELVKFSRRTSANLNHWASRYGISENTKDTYKKAKDKRLGRYVAVNLENYYTIEFRIFRGTLYYKTFIAALQLVDEICKLAVDLSDKEFEDMSWSDFVFLIDKSRKPELIEYLKSKRLYVNEIAEECEVI